MKSPRPEQSVTPFSCTLTLTCTHFNTESQAHSQKLIQQNHGASTVRQVLGDTKVREIRTRSRTDRQLEHIKPWLGMENITAFQVVLVRLVT